MSKIMMSMEKTKFNWLNAVVLGGAILLLSACGNDSDEPMAKGEVEFQITDAPSDDANIKSVMVTVADVKVDGQSISGFTRQTIDLKAYQEGNTKLLGNAELDAKTYSNITLVLDLDTDVNGNSPGCYVLTKDDVKFKLKSTAIGKTDLILNQSWKVAGNAKTNIVMDFDLRKSIRYSDDTSIRYTFVSDNSLKSAVRIVVKENAGTIKGTYENESDVTTEKIIVYAYKKGTFNAAVETQPQGEDEVLFAKAVASTEVKETLSGNVYTLAFLEEGEYELHFIAYQKNTETGRFMFASELEAETSVNGSVGKIIKVDAGASVSISAKIKGLL
jgi:hypothetical protein